MASLASDTLDVERGVQQRSLKIEQRQNKKFVAICFAVAVISVVSAMVGYYAGVHSVGSANTHPGHSIDHNTAFKLDRAITKAFHVTAPVPVPSGQPRTAGRANIKMQSDSVAYVMDKFKSMTKEEKTELWKELEETLGVSVGGAAMMAPSAAAGGGADAPAEEEQTEFDVVIESFAADKKIKVMSVARGIAGLGLKEIKELVEAAPKTLKEGVAKELAEGMKKDLEEAGAVVTLK